MDIGVAVVSQVLCTSATLNKRSLYDIHLFLSLKITYEGKLLAIGSLVKAKRELIYTRAILYVTVHA